MDAVFQSILSGGPFLLLHAGVTIAMLIAGVTLYMWMTPYEDIAQIRAGNGAAGIALGGAILGMAIRWRSPCAAASTCGTSCSGAS